MSRYPVLYVPRTSDDDGRPMRRQLALRLGTSGTAGMWISFIPALLLLGYSTPGLQSPWLLTVALCCVHGRLTDDRHQMK